MEDEDEPYLFHTEQYFFLTVTEIESHSSMAEMMSASGDRMGREINTDAEKKEEEATAIEFRSEEKRRKRGRRLLLYITCDEFETD